MRRPPSHTCIAPILLASATAFGQPSFEDRLWRTVDAPAAEFEERFADLTRQPEAHWRTAYVLLNRGRSWETPPRPWSEVKDADRYRAWFEEQGFETGEIQIHDVGDTPGLWYTVTLPANSRSADSLPAYVDLSWSGAAQTLLDRGWAIVRPHPFLFGGGPPETALPWTGGTIAQSVLETIVSDLERRFQVDRDRVALGGFSRMGNVAWYQAFHRPDLWSCVVPAAGYFPPDLVEACSPNAQTTHLLAAWGTDPGHRDANAFTRSWGRKLESQVPEKVTLHESEGRAIDGGFEEVLATTLEKSIRESLPRTLRFVSTDPRHRRCAWAEILSFGRQGRPNEMAIVDLSREVVETVDRYPRRPGSFRLEVRDERTLVVDTERIRSLRIFLSPALFRMEGTLRVFVNGNEREVPIEPSLRTLLTTHRRDRDRERLFPAWIDLRISR